MLIRWVEGPVYWIKLGEEPVLLLLHKTGGVFPFLAAFSWEILHKTGGVFPFLAAFSWEILNIYMLVCLGMSACGIDYTIITIVTKFKLFTTLTYWLIAWAVRLTICLRSMELICGGERLHLVLGGTYRGTACLLKWTACFWVLFWGCYCINLKLYEEI